MRENNMAELEVTLEELRAQIKEGREFTLAESFYFNNNILIGTERVLSEKDIDRMDGKCGGLIRVKEFRAAIVEDTLVNQLIKFCVKVLKEHKDYSGIHSEKRKAVENKFNNILPKHDYLTLRMSQMNKNAPRIFMHSVHTAIKSLLVDIAHQAKFNNGMMNSIQSEEVIVGSILRNIGYLKTSKETVSKKIGELRNSRDPLYLKVPELSFEIVQNDNVKHDLSPETLRIVHESFELSDGSGFPQGLKKEDIYPPALLVGACAEFDLTLSGELSQSARGFSETMRRMMSLSGKFDKDVISVINDEFRYLLSKE
jgi:HD-GYP domain-containing protein (c-di-GMP phosphodiesterase class II)